MAGSNEDRFDALMKHIERSEDRIRGEIAESRNHLQRQIDGLGKKIDVLGQKVDGIGVMYNTLSASYIALDVLVLGSFAVTQRKEEIKAVLEWWGTVDFAAVEMTGEIPEAMRETLLTKHEGYRSALENLSA